MAKNKKRKSPDLRIITEEHPQFVGRIASIFVQYRNILGYAFMGLLVVTVLFLLMQHNNRVKNNEASAMLQSALDQYQRDLATSTISIQTGTDDDGPGAQLAVQARSPGSFQAVFDNYPGTNAGRNALFMAATSHMNLGDNPKALDAFNRFIETFPNDPLTPSAKLAKATVLFNDGQATESLDLLNNIERTHPNFRLLDVVTYEKAKRYEFLERWNDARKAYETLMELYPDSAFKSMSDSALKKIEQQFPESDSNSASGLS